jgi:hypothetical protein
MRKINWWWAIVYVVTVLVAGIFQDIQMATYIGVLFILCGKALRE